MVVEIPAWFVLILHDSTVSFLWLSYQIGSGICLYSRFSCGEYVKRISPVLSDTVSQPGRALLKCGWWLVAMAHGSTSAAGQSAVVVGVAVQLVTV